VVKQCKQSVSRDQLRHDGVPGLQTLARGIALSDETTPSPARQSAILSRMVSADGAILSNLRRGALEHCVLAMLRREPLYGLDIARRLTADGVLMASEGTLYPLLARLRRAGLVQTTWQESVEGPPRRYYSLTRDGAASVSAFASTWKPFRDAVDAALEGDVTP